jgi:hypothetical protein
LLRFAAEVPSEPAGKENVDRKILVAELKKSVDERRAKARTVPAAEYESSIKSEIQRITELRAKDPTAYHNQVLLQDGGVENLTQHFGRVRLSPANGQPKRLIVLISGNNEPLTREMDRNHSYRGTMYMFDQLGKMDMENTDIIQLKAGETILPVIGTQPPQEIHTRVAGTHIENVLQDALGGRGIFAGRQYESMRGFGFSYGAGALQNFLEGMQKRGETGTRIDRTIYMDGIQFGSNAVPLTARSSLAREHFHVHQTNRTFTMPIRGEALASAQKGDVEAQFKTENAEQTLKKAGLDHRTFHDAILNRGSFDGAVAALTQGW